jgi:hypothetical protein
MPRSGPASTQLTDDERIAALEISDEGRMTLINTPKSDRQTVADPPWQNRATSKAPKAGKQTAIVRVCQFRHDSRLFRPLPVHETLRLSEFSQGAKLLQWEHSHLPRWVGNGQNRARRSRIALAR